MNVLLVDVDSRIANLRYNNRKDDSWLNAFSRWVNTGLYRIVPWDQYDTNPDPEWRFDPQAARTRPNDPTMAEAHAQAIAAVG
jgi:hypothetical protein